VSTSPDTLMTCQLKTFSAGAGLIDPYCVDHPEYCIGGSLGSSYYTTNGTFNGSGIALATEFWNHEEFKVMTVYFQHWTGEIRSIQLTPKGEWIGGGASEVIVSDAKNATPISAVSYSLNSTSVVSFTHKPLKSEMLTQMPP
jgi:hypothetical protein